MYSVNIVHLEQVALKEMDGLRCRTSGRFMAAVAFSANANGITVIALRAMFVISTTLSQKYLLYPLIN